MTANNPEAGNDTGTPEPAKNPLPAYLTDMQSRALRLAGVVRAIAFITNEGRCDEGRIALTYLAEELADDLNQALDAINIPNGEIR